MPYSGVMWVTLPVACKRKETRSDTVDEAETMTSFISPGYSHTHPHNTHTVLHTAETVYTAHTSLSTFIYTSAKFGGSSESICLELRGLSLLNIQA